MSVRLVALLMLVAVAIGASGCGGSSSGRGGGASANAQIEAICARHNRAIAALAVDPVQSAEGLTGIQRRRATIEQATLRELKTVTPRTSLRPMWSSFLAERQALINATLAYSGHRPSSRSVAEADAAAQAQHLILGMAGQAGLTECTRAR
ncbi:MAG TPA: hypothetical protein VK790_06780 [Solirubrobacteraceae bacterium]|nr:hypothetical protein [Solirubrobacteraceae bacterium]